MPRRTTSWTNDVENPANAEETGDDRGRRMSAVLACPVDEPSRGQRADRGARSANALMTELAQNAGDVEPGEDRDGWGDDAEAQRLR